MCCYTQKGDIQPDNVVLFYKGKGSQSQTIFVFYMRILTFNQNSKWLMIPITQNYPHHKRA